MSVEYDRAAFFNDTCWLRLQNGWTVSLSETDTPPAICSLAAWPTRQDNLASSSETFLNLRLFEFAGGRTDCRCWTYADIRKALQEITRASFPDESDDYNRAAFDMLAANRARPETCDFCKQPFTGTRYPVPEEGRAWACRECEARWAKEDARS